MATQLSTGVSFGLTPMSYGDPAFEPQSGFDFDNTHDGSFPHMRQDLTSSQSFNDANYNFGMNVQRGTGTHNDGLLPDAPGRFRMGTNKFAHTHSMSTDTDASSLWGGTERSPVVEDDNNAYHIREALLPQIADPKMRFVNASHFDQMPAPGNTTSEHNVRKLKVGVNKRHAVSESKMDNSQRARNAANQRHAKAKKSSEVREDSKMIDSPDSDGEGVGVESKREKYREKNRLAAAKCRMKKKDNVQGLEERSREMSAENSFAKVEMRQLRDELTNLRTMALHHSAHIQGCNCLALHAYNARKAGELASEWSIPELSHSPSSSANIDATSPASFASTAEYHHHSSGPPHLMATESAPVGYGPPQMMAPPAVPRAATMGDNPQHSFSDYLRNSAGGSTGFT